MTTTPTMLTPKSLYDASVYTDLQSLKELNHQSQRDPKGAQHAVAQQFESLLIQMLLKSMRDTNTAFKSDNTNQQSEMYNDLFDKQLSLVLAKSGIGLAKTIEDYLSRTQPVASEGNAHPTSTPALGQSNTMLPTLEAVPTPPAATTAPPAPMFTSTLEFVKTLWSSAKQAASVLGVDPKLLLAQAALETNWGKSILPDGTQTSHNLFNIKADPGWHKAALATNTIEYDGQQLVKEKAAFRVYDSFAASFNDYVHFLTSNPRYQTALTQANNPQQFVQALQQANYATDSHYSDKIMAIYNSEKFNHLFQLANLV